MSELSHAQIGRAFVKKYYTTLHDNPECLYKLYKASSTFVHGGEDCLGEADVAFGPDEIAQRIAEMDFRGCRTRVLQVDSAITLNDGIVIQVCGELSNRGGPMRRFMQTFVLCPLDKKLFYVVNDIFRYNDDVFGEYTPSEHRVIMDSARYCVTQPEQLQQQQQPTHFSFQNSKLENNAQTCHDCAAMNVHNNYAYSQGVESAETTRLTTQADCKAAMHNTLLCSPSSVVLPPPPYCNCYNAPSNDCSQQTIFTSAHMALPMGSDAGRCCKNPCIGQYAPPPLITHPNTTDKPSSCIHQPKSTQCQCKLNNDMEFTQSALGHSYHERNNSALQNEGCWSSFKTCDQPDSNNSKNFPNCATACECGRPKPTKPSYNTDSSKRSNNTRLTNATNPPSANQNASEGKPSSTCRNGDCSSSGPAANSPVVSSGRSSYNEHQQHTERLPMDQEFCSTGSALYYPSSSHKYQGGVNCFSGGELNTGYMASSVTNNVPPATDQWSQLSETSKEGCFGTTENTDLYRHQMGTSDKSYSKSWAAIASSGRSKTSANSLFQDDDPFFPFNNQADVPYFGNGPSIGHEYGSSLLGNRQTNSMVEHVSPRHRSSIDQSSTASSKNSLASPPTRYPEEYQVFVGNISNATEESSLISLLSKYGKLVELKLSERSGYDKPKFAFVVFDNTESVDKIISTCNQSPIRLDGKRLNIERRHPSSRTGSKRNTHNAGTLAGQFSLGSESPALSATRKSASSLQTSKTSRIGFTQGGRSNGNGGGGGGSLTYTKASKQGSNGAAKPSQQHHQQQQHVH